MTACNLIVQPQAAYLLTDTACYTADGIVTHFQPKVIELTHAIVEPAAIAFTGNAFPQEMTAALERLGPASASALLPALPDLIADAERIVRGRMPPGQRPSITLLIASFNRATIRPAGHIISNDPSMFLPGSGYVPMTVRAMDWKAHVDHAAAFGGQRRLSDPRQFDAVGDGARLLEQQRREPNDGDNFPIIGGQGLLTKVDIYGVQTRTICEWQNDTVGARIAA
jgi:hypothetical protein